MVDEQTRLQEMGDNVRWARQRMKLSQKELGELLGYSRATINRIENGHAQLRPTKLERLSRISGIPIEYLLYGPGYPLAKPRSDGRISD